MEEKLCHGAGTLREREVPAGRRDCVAKGNVFPVSVHGPYRQSAARSDKSGSATAAFIFHARRKCSQKTRVNGKSLSGCYWQPSSAWRKAGTSTPKRKETHSVWCGLWIGALECGPWSVGSGLFAPSNMLEFSNCYYSVLKKKKKRLLTSGLPRLNWVEVQPVRFSSVLHRLNFCLAEARSQAWPLFVLLSEAFEESTVD